MSNGSVDCTAMCPQTVFTLVRIFQIILIINIGSLNLVMPQLFGYFVPNVFGWYLGPLPSRFVFSIIILRLDLTLGCYTH